MKKTSILLPLILLGYATLYIATSKQPICEGDCEKIQNLRTRMMNNRPYVWTVNRLGQDAGALNRFYVIVKDTIGIDWNRLADTACIYSREVGLTNQQIFVLLPRGVVDTVARLSCP